MRAIQLAVLLAASFGLSGCAASYSLPGDKGVLWIGNEQYQLVHGLGYTNAYSPSASRNRTGEKLFLQFRDRHNGTRVVTVSSNEIWVSELPGYRAYLDDEGKPTCWYSGEHKTWEFVNGYLLPTNKVLLAVNDGFLAMKDTQGARTQWLARLAAPLEALAFLPGKDTSYYKIFRREEILHIFFKTNPDQEKNKQGLDFLKHIKYRIEGDRVVLSETNSLEWARGVFDFDPESNLALLHPQQFHFPGAWLANLQTGERRRLGSAANDGLFLKYGVIHQFQQSVGQR